VCCLLHCFCGVIVSVACVLFVCCFFVLLLVLYFRISSASAVSVFSCSTVSSALNVRSKEPRSATLVFVVFTVCGFFCVCCPFVCLCFYMFYVVVRVIGFVCLSTLLSAKSEQTVTVNCEVLKLTHQLARAAGSSAVAMSTGVHYHLTKR